MITNFEEYTYEVNKYEKRAADYIEALLRSNGNIYSNKQLAEKIYQRSGELKEYKFADSRIRSIINYLRRTSAPNIIANSNGYKITDNKEELLKYHQSITERIGAMQVIADQVAFHIKKNNINF
jgi:hypothetical protein